MNWSALAAWLYRDGEPDYAKLAAHRIGVVYIDPNSANAAQVVTALTARGLTAGVYEATSWHPGATPLQFAQAVSAHVASLPLKAGPVMLDLEAVPFEWIKQVIPAYRKLRPTRATAYTNEPFKDGSVVPIPDLVAAGFHFYPQTYLGDMSPVDTAAVALELCRWGVPPAMVHPFYDGARMPAEVRDGCVFTMERLP